MKFLTKSTTSERVTAAVSTIIAVAVLGVAVSAQQSRTSRADQLAQLESEARLQIRLGFRHDQTEHEGRVGQLESVLAGWRDAERSEHNDVLLAKWLRDAMARSMPGAVRPFATAPAFDVPTSGRGVPLAASVTAPPAVQPGDSYPDDELPGSTTGLSDAQETELAAVEPPPASTDPPAPVGDVLAQSSPVADVDPAASPAPTLADPLPAVDDATPPSAAVATASQPAPKEPASGQPIVENILPPAPNRQPAKPTRPTGKVAVNLTQLTDRVADYHRQLNALRRAVDRGAASLDQLAGAVDTLEHLAAHHDFIQLYVESLTARERRFVAAPKTWTPLASRLRVALQQSTDAEGDFLGTIDRQRNSRVARLLKRLESLDASATQ